MSNSAEVQKAEKPSPLFLTATTTATDYWNDSCSIDELSYAIKNGAVGATTNPSIVLNVLKKELAVWKEPMARLVADHPDWNEEQIAWRLIEEGLQERRTADADLRAREGKKGRLSMQTNPVNYRNADALVAQSVHHELAPNIQVKIPVTAAGVAATGKR